VRKVLVLTALAFASAAAALLNPGTGSATTQVFGYLFRPTGTDQVGPVLACGWHDNCDGSFTDPEKKGLDWKWADGGHATRLRMKLIGPSTPTYVAYGALENTFGSCPSLRLTFRRISDGAFYGYVKQAHTNGPAANYSWIAGPSYTYDLSTGTMVDPNNDDCSSYWHVMQWYHLSPAGNILSKNTNIPNESACYHCDSRAYGVWSPAEYIWGWSGPP
jgi:hypothetical protein